jgi:hypothetical protein
MGDRVRGGPDRVTVALVSVAAFLFVLALLGTQLSLTGSGQEADRPVLLRRIYRTTVVERVLPAGARGGGGGPSVTQSVSGSSAPLAPTTVPVTRTS